MSCKQFFALVSLPKEQIKGSVTNAKQHKTSVSHARSSSVPYMATPKYETEREVTLAICSGELKFGTEQAYRLAKEYTAYLKKLNQPRFFPKKNQPAPLPNNKYIHVMFQK